MKYVLLALFFLPAMAYSQPGKTARLNILWITTEDMSPGHLGCYGGKVAKTPNIDQLAREGVRYTRAYSTAGVCSPSRNAIISGMYPTSIGGHNMRNYQEGTFAAAFQKGAPASYSIVPPEEMRCYPEFLRAAGYYCTNQDKQDYQLQSPVTVWDENSKTADWRGRAPGQPFFSIINFMDTHESQIFSRDDRPLTVDPAKVELLPFYQDTPVMRKDVARHLSNIEDMDRKVGEVIQKLKDDGLYDNTIIFFYSDHGDGLPYVKREIYDRGLRFPLIIRYPKAAGAGTVVNDLVSFVDFAPTVLSLAHIGIPGYMQGQAFAGAAKAKTPRKYIYAARDRMANKHDRVRAVGDGRFKYFKNYYPELPYYQDLLYRKQMKSIAEMLQLRDEGKLSELQMHWFRPNKPEEELFDTENDPHELKNLAGDPRYADKLKELREAHVQWIKDYGDLGAVDEKAIVQVWWNGRDEAPVTAAPAISVDRNKVTLSCLTNGASIGYKTRKDDKAWKVYTGPFTLQPGEQLQAVAQRIGFQQSEITEFKSK